MEGTTTELISMNWNIMIRTVYNKVWIQDSGSPNGAVTVLTIDRLNLEKTFSRRSLVELSKTLTSIQSSLSTFMSYSSYELRKFYLKRNCLKTIVDIFLFYENELL